MLLRTASIDSPWFFTLAEKFSFPLSRLVLCDCEVFSFYILASLAELEPECGSPNLSLSPRSLPKHERLVDLHGSVIDYNYGGGSSIAVLLIMERLHRDLYTGLKVREAARDKSQLGAGSLLDFVLSCCFSTSHFHRDCNRVTSDIFQNLLLA